MPVIAKTIVLRKNAKAKNEAAKELKIARKKILHLAESLNEVNPECRMSAYKRAVKEETSEAPRRGPGSFEGGKKK